MADYTGGSYVWGLDASFGTHVTNYIIVIPCLIYGYLMLTLYNSPTQPNELDNKDQHKCNKTVQGSLRNAIRLASSMAFISCAGMSAIGGVIHQVVPSIDPLTSSSIFLNDYAKDLHFWNVVRLHIYQWYAIWQIADILAVVFGCTMILLAYLTVKLDQNSNLRFLASNGNKFCNSDSYTLQMVDRKIGRSVHSFLTAIFLYTIWRLLKIYQYRQDIYCSRTNDEVVDIEEARYDKDKMDIWSTVEAGAVFAGSTFLYATVMLYLLHKSYKYDKGTGEAIYSPNQYLLKFFGSILVLIGGLIQIILSFSCGKNNPIYCPLPIEFNHNAVYHVFLGLGVSLLFLADYSYFKQFIHTSPSRTLKSD
uniref:uncharacterized protein LOC120342803 n=1 Tax=Styela clava TaxID=7725 RepID=UPI00193A32B3|nr:uncharacterized protein LOC120342803 [Styela clava]XP_039267719.1 uncharacterized protein LOC120342803 [Styela clava]